MDWLKFVHYGKVECDSDCTIFGCGLKQRDGTALWAMLAISDGLIGPMDGVDFDEITHPWLPAYIRIANEYYAKAEKAEQETNGAWKVSVMKDYEGHGDLIDLAEVAKHEYELDVMEQLNDIYGGTDQDG